ncbi:WbqC family protein [Streptomyces sp. NPDC056486]|uniref:WbqC family protein n=1 Tax=Streptomyces sp. NPDC056486 TaxID=3345835 RepID=UPI0036A10300
MYLLSSEASRSLLWSLKTSTSTALASLPLKTLRGDSGSLCPRTYPEDDRPSSERPAWPILSGPVAVSQHYRGSPFWAALRSGLDAVGDGFAATGRTAVIAEASTRLLLELLGWKGWILYSSEFAVRQDRSLRLADLALTTKARGYLCGPGGMKYLYSEPFTSRGVAVIPFLAPSNGVWEGAQEVSALRTLMAYGPNPVAKELRGLANHHRSL